MVYNTYNSFTVESEALGLSSVMNTSAYAKSKRQHRQNWKYKSFSSVLKKAEQSRKDEYTPVGERLGKA